MFPRYFPLLMLIAASLSACRLPQPAMLPTASLPSPSATTPLPSSPGSSTPPPSAPALIPASPTPSASPPPTASITQYLLQAELDYFNHTLAVVETIHYTNRAGVSLPELLLVIRPLDWAGSFQLDALRWTDGSPLPNTEMEGALLHIPLAQPLEPGARLSLQLEYRLSLPAIPSQHPLPYGYTQRQTNLVDWYPYIPPYRPGEGWLAHPPAVTGEHLVYDLADYQVQLSLAQPVPGLVLAASAPAVQDGLTYAFSLPAARAFALSASPYYQVLAQTTGEATVYSYFFAYNASAGQAVLEATALALSLYSEQFGAYPRSSLSIVEADFQDGMEYSGLYFISRDFYEWYAGTPRGYLTLIGAHETAHQWWFDRVGNDQALEPWLDEALCTYMENLFYAHLDAKSPSQGAQSYVDWWWYFRIDLYAPSGTIDGTIYDFSTFRAYRDAIYLRGAQFLEALRQQMGDEAFFAFLRSYASQMSGQVATSADFFRILGDYSSDIRSLKEIYFSP